MVIEGGESGQLFIVLCKTIRLRHGIGMLILIYKKHLLFWYALHIKKLFKYLYLWCHI